MLMSLERKKKIAELARVRAARLELEVKLEESEIQSARLREHIQAQEVREKELETELAAQG